MLQWNKTLEHISLCKLHISDLGAQVLAERLLENKSLTSLHLRANKIGGFGSEALAALLLSGSNISELDLTANLMGGEGARAFETVLSTSGKLQILCLGYNSIDDEGLARLAKGIARNERLSLRKFLVWGNYFGNTAPPEFNLMFQNIRGRLQTDIQPYTVDGVVMIAKKDSDNE
jgi:Ran GTPase-activating protein (RanGAP) involved in mRNA processing and transport